MSIAVSQPSLMCPKVEYYISPQDLRYLARTGIIAKQTSLDAL